MPKMLVAYGSRGRYGSQWNWCDGDEPVGVDGFVCDGACSCGCGRSFVGILSRKATTLAAVVEVSQDVFDGHREALRKSAAASWGDNAEIGDRAAALFDELSGEVFEFGVGSVLSVVRGDGVRLEKVG